jgi:hypothetical protein
VVPSIPLLIKQPKKKNALERYYAKSRMAKSLIARGVVMATVVAVAAVVKNHHPRRFQAPVRLLLRLMSTSFARVVVLAQRVMRKS